MKFEVMMIFKQNADIDALVEEIKEICKDTKAEFISSDNNMIVIGSDEFDYYGPAYMNLMYSPLIKENLLDAYAKDMIGITSCREGLRTPLKLNGYDLS